VSTELQRTMPRIRAGTSQISWLRNVARQSPDDTTPGAAAASRPLAPVASHAVGFAEPRPGGRSPGIGAYRGRRGRAGNHPRPSLVEPHHASWPASDRIAGGAFPGARSYGFVPTRNWPDRPGDERRHKPKGRAGYARPFGQGCRFRRMAQLPGALRAGIHKARPVDSFPRGGGR
jgi:hypothetical protein